MCTALVHDKIKFLHVIDRICHDEVNRTRAGDEMSKIPQAMNEQSAAVIRVYCSMSPSQIEITKVVERLIAFASTQEPVPII